VRALALRALAIDSANLLAAAADRRLSPEEHARLIAVARVTAPTRTEDADPTAGMSDDQIVAEARKALLAVEDDSGTDHRPEDPAVPAAAG
jgi:hypothetical protein